MSDRPRAFNRKPGGGYKRKIARLQARVTELEQSLAESERQDRVKCTACPWHMTESYATPGEAQPQRSTS